MRRLASALLALGLLATTTSAASASELTAIRQSTGTTSITTITENGRPVSLATMNYRYRSTLGFDNPYVTRLQNGTRAEIWKVQAMRGQCLDLTMHSTELDSYLGLYRVDPTGGDATKIDEDDDHGGGLDARIQRTVAVTGTYYVVTTAANGRDGGRYSLEIASCDGSPVGSGFPTEPAAGPFRPNGPGTRPFAPINGLTTGR